MSSTVTTSALVALFLLSAQAFADDCQSGCTPGDPITIESLQPESTDESPCINVPVDVRFTAFDVDDYLDGGTGTCPDAVTIHYWVYGPDGKEVASGTSTPDDEGSGSFSFVPEEWGTYYIEIEADDTPLCTGGDDGPQPASTMIEIPCNPDCGDCSGRQCQGQAGHGVAQNKGVSARFSLGPATDGRPAGYLYIRAEQPHAGLAEPAALQLATNWPLDVVRDEQTNALEQVKAPQTTVVIETVEHETYVQYRIRFCPSEGCGTPHTSWIIRNPDGQAACNRLHLIKYDGSTESGTEVMRYEYTHTSAGDPTWVLLAKAGGATLRQEVEVRQSTGPGAEKRTYTVKEADETVVFKREQYFTDLSFGWAKTKEILDPNGAALTSEWGYYTDSPERFGFTRWGRHADGGWQWYVYDDLGRLVRVNSAWRDCSFTEFPDPGDGQAVVYSYSGASRRPISVSTSLSGRVVELTAYQYLTGDTTYTTLVKRCTNPTAPPLERTYLTTTYTYPDVTEKRYVSIEYPDGRKDYYSAYEDGYFHYNDNSPGDSTFDQSQGADGTPAVRVAVKYGTTTSENGVAYKSTKDVRITTDAGVPLMEETWVHTGGGVFERVAWTAYKLDSRSRTERIDRSNGTRVVTAWDCCGPDYEEDESGVYTDYTYDALGRLDEQVKSGVSASGEYPEQPAITTDPEYDARGRVLQTTVSAGSVSLTTSMTYDLAGRVATRTDAGGYTTTYTYQSLGHPSYKGQVTETRPDGATVVTQYYRDGRVKSVTGTGVVGQHHDYGANEDGTQWTKVATGADINSPRYVKTTVNAVGHVIEEQRPGYSMGDPVTLTTSYTYDASGRLSKVQRPGLADTLYEYDDAGTRELVRSGLDLGGGAGTLDLNSPDRITETVQEYVEPSPDEWWREQRSTVYTTVGEQPDSVITTYRQRLTGYTFSAGETTTDEAVQKIEHVRGGQAVATQTTTTTTKTDRTAGLVTRTVDVPSASNHESAVTRNGLLQKTTSPSGATTRYGYDAIGRQVEVLGPRPNVWAATVYGDGGANQDGTVRPEDRIWKIETSAGTEQAPVTLTTTYACYAGGVAGAGQIAWVSNPAGKCTRYAYDAHGRVAYTWGEVPQPTWVEYDSYGQRWRLHTYRAEEGWTGTEWPAEAGNGDVTTWTHDDATGLLERKTYADATYVDYTYTADGKLHTRTWARDVTTTYGYWGEGQNEPETGELHTVDYEDATPDLEYTYDRLGRVLTVTAAGDSTTDHAFDCSAWPEEVVETISGLYSKRVTREYAPATGGQLLGVQVGTAEDPDQDYAAGYEYAAATGRLDRVIGPGLPGGASGGAFYEYVSGSGLVARMRVRDAAGNVRGEAERAYEPRRDLLDYVAGRWDPVPDPDGAGQTLVSKYDYTSDGLARRTNVEHSGLAFGGTIGQPLGYNDRSELTSSSRGGASWAYAYDPIGNRTEYTETGSTVYYCTNAVNQYEHTDDQAHCPSPLEDFGYDADGNLTADGTMTYVWDAENRLVEARVTAPQTAADRKTTFGYDYRSRRVVKRVVPWDPVAQAWDEDSPLQQRRFVWGGGGTGGWLLLMELEGEDNTIVRQYTWGLDLAGQSGGQTSGLSIEGAGGIGGLLAVHDASYGGGSDFVYFCDGNGNVDQLMDLAVTDPATALKARYEYDPYGNATAATGAYASTNRIRFSTKYLDGQTGMYYFGERYYDATLGSWMTRDHAQEQGGLRLYGFVGNAPSTAHDAIGRAPCKDPSEGGRHPVYPLLDFILDLRNFFSRHDIDVWSEGGTCHKVDEELRGFCPLCHQRCKWECTDVSICVNLEWKNAGCCAQVFPAATICNSGWVFCLLGDHILFSCEPGLHDVTRPGSIGDVRLRCWGFDVGALRAWFERRFGLDPGSFLPIEPIEPPPKR